MDEIKDPGLLGYRAELVSVEKRATEADRQGLFIAFSLSKGPFQMTQSTINLNGTSTPTEKRKSTKICKKRMHTS